MSLGLTYEHGPVKTYSVYDYIKDISFSRLQNLLFPKIYNEFSEV